MSTMSTTMSQNFSALAEKVCRLTTLTIELSFITQHSGRQCDLTEPTGEKRDEPQWYTNSKLSRQTKIWFDTVFASANLVFVSTKTVLDSQSKMGGRFLLSCIKKISTISTKSILLITFISRLREMRFNHTQLRFFGFDTNTKIS